MEAQKSQPEFTTNTLESSARAEQINKTKELLKSLETDPVPDKSVRNIVEQLFEMGMKNHSERIKRTVDSLIRIKQNVCGFLIVNAKDMPKERKQQSRARRRSSMKRISHA